MAKSGKEISWEEFLGYVLLAGLGLLVLKALWERFLAWLALPGHKALFVLALAGLAALAWGALRARRSVRHGPGVVRGMEVIEGGWAGDADIASHCEFGPPRPGNGLIPLGKLNGRIVRVHPEKGKVKMAGHMLVVGATGTGKSYTLVRNDIIAGAMDGHSMVITDPKGELLRDMGFWLAERQGYRVLVFNLIDPSRSHWWNPILECRGWDEMMDLTNWLISSAGDDHAFFSGGEKNVFLAAVAYVRWALPEEYRHLRAALSFLSWPQEAADEAYKEAFRQGKVPQDAIETWSAAQGHYDNYVEGVRNKVRELVKGRLAALTSRSDFDLRSLGEEKTALFMILPEEGDYRAILVPFYTFMFRRLREKADADGGRLKVPVRFIMDEFANIGKIPDIDKLFSLGRGRGLYGHIILQNIGQLKGLYSKDRMWSAVAGNCPIKLCLATDDLETARWFTSLMGGAKVRRVTERRDVTYPWNKLETPKKTEATADVETMFDWELLQLPEDDCVAVLRGKKPLYMQKLAWTELPQSKEIMACPKANPEMFTGVRDCAVALPPWPEKAEAAPQEPKRSRGRAAERAVEPEPEPEPGRELGGGPERGEQSEDTFADLGI
ncbi:VirD4-like conjugal transfer protein, CD1115 family [Desulfovirgula thermocuniculi]|uniref:VirD4-like conjugal transfer protein, CD1115 family n=1 Tax=Desulfovirgula thermocuniculi TaxID=348842 RepID=UPI00041DA94C|nr:type IV secretory system conjugative DNA transfer family protein [Desulfovirgula thermocuniculi]